MYFLCMDNNPALIHTDAQIGEAAVILNLSMCAALMSAQNRTLLAATPD